ncbi:4314_t:CDS:1, partial [Gigaspora rosea]
EVAEILGIGEAIVACVVAEYNKGNSEEPSLPKIQGQPKKKLDSDLVGLLHSLILAANTSSSHYPHP